MPIGACIAAEAAERAGHKVMLLDLMFVDNIQRHLEHAIETTQPDVVGISVRNIDNNDMKNPRTFFDEVSSLMQMIRKKTDASIVLGGAAVSIMPEQLLRYTHTSIAVLTNGESVFPRLLSALKNGESFKKVPGIARIENDIFIKNPLSEEYFQTSYPCLVPDFFRWINVKSYLARFSTVPVQTKRGCPFKCIYCTYAAGEGPNYQLCNATSVINEIKKLVSRGLRDIEFVDNVFNAPYEHALEICSLLAGARLPVRLQAMELNPKFVDDRLLTAMEQAGFVGIGITAESADDLILKNLGKNYTADDVHRASHVIGRHKLPCFWLFLLGGPGETHQSVQRTLDFARRHVRPTDTAFFNVGIRIYPGTELEHIARQDGSLHLTQQEMLNTVFYFSRHLDRQWFSKTLSRTVTENLNFLDSESLSLPALSVVLRLAYSFGVRQPLWKYTRFIRRTLRLLRVYK